MSEPPVSPTSVSAERHTGRTPLPCQKGTTILARFSSWLKSGAAPRGWVVRPWYGAPPPELTTLQAMGFPTFDLQLDHVASPAITARRTWEELSALRDRRRGPLGLIGIDHCAAACVTIAAMPEMDVKSLVLAPGSFELRGAPPTTCATRLIGPACDSHFQRHIDLLSGASGGGLDVVLLPFLDDATLEASSLEWFEHTLGRRNKVELFNWLASRMQKRRRKLQRRLAVSMQASAVLVAMAAPQARAGTITVGSACTIRDAIIAAENDAASGGCPAGSGADTVLLNGGTYLLKSTFGTGLPVITTPITISGNGAVLDGEGEVRVIDVAGGTLGLLSSTVTGGKASSGGGVYNNAGTITISGTTISGNTATSSGGGVYNNGGTVTITDSTISGNTATGSGGGVYNSGGVTVTSSTISGNSAASGGGIYNLGTPLKTASVVVEGSSLVGNTVTGVGGAAANVAEDAGSAQLMLNNVVARDNRAFGGGAVAVGAQASGTVTVSVSGSTLTGNTVTGGGGAIDAESTLGGTVTVTVNESSLASNTAGIDGGALRAETLSSGTLTITVSGGSITDNVAGGDGGGLHVASMNGQGTLSVMGATLSGNSASGQGGGLYSGAGTAQGFTVTVDASTLSGNTAGSSGGGIFAAAAGDATLATTLRNSTISGNTVTSGVGGGIRLASMDTASTSLVVDNSALAGNASSAGGGIDLLGEGQLPLTATLNNSIITKSVGDGDCAAVGTGQFLGANNLIDDFARHGEPGACAGLGQEAVTLFDEVLKDNGGPTLTHTLLPGSNAIDAGAGECADLVRDQRGARRPLDGDGDQTVVCDIGPVEVGETPIFRDGFESGGTYAWGGTVDAAHGTDDDRHQR